MIKRKLSSNEKFLISFIIVLIVAIAFNWEEFSKQIKEVFDQSTPTEQTVE
ncbi:hypothetical protein [Sunxiuqinia indica]|uniref:hypothetical protein n=1 Tax=Sunxiuqinia indica TaxID=2692584 RepID=UPI00135BDE97|nr:hypothetical protein [Sunxiuqinia indica]